MRMFGYGPLAWAAVKALAVGLILGGMFAFKFWPKIHTLPGAGAVLVARGGASLLTFFFNLALSRV